MIYAIQNTPLVQLVVYKTSYEGFLNSMLLNEKKLQNAALIR